jgi:hypothetical protein
MVGVIELVGRKDTVGAGVGAHKLLVHDTQDLVLPNEMVPEAHALHADPS